MKGNTTSKKRGSKPHKLLVKAPQPKSKQEPQTPTHPGESQRSRLMNPPPKMSEEEEKNWAEFNLTEVEYRRIERVRHLSERNAYQQQMLEKHDEIERRMKEEPQEVFREAHEALDKGTSLLAKLIRAGRLHEKFLGADGTVHFERDEALDCLISRTHFLNRHLLRLASARRPGACAHLFSEAVRFAETFIRLAQAHPEDFINSAEDSLTMPSLRTASLSYTADAEAIAKAIHLGEKHLLTGIHDQRERFGSFCLVLVADILTSIHRARDDFRSNQQTAAYLNVSADEYIKSTHYPDLYEHVMACSRLPEWKQDKETASHWWTKRVLPMVKEEFQKLVRDPSRHPALWEELQRRGETRKNTTKDMCRTLEKNCKNKFEQLVRAHRTPAHGQAG